MHTKAIFKKFLKGGRGKKVSLAILYSAQDLCSHGNKAAESLQQEERSFMRQTALSSSKFNAIIHDTDLCADKSHVYRRIWNVNVKGQKQTLYHIA